MHLLLHAAKMALHTGEQATGERMPELTIGDFIRHKREQRGVGKRALSVACGLSESYISKLEAGAMDNPSFAAVSKIALELGMTTPEVMHLVRQQGQKRP